MNSARFSFLAFLILLFSFSILSYAGVPQMMNYQGKITKPTGALVDTTISMEFTIYDDSTGGNILWADTLSSVDVEKGIFSVLLGSINPIPDSVFDSSIRYLGVKVGGDPGMTPRKAIVSVGYAYKAEYADTAQYAHVAVSDGDWEPDTSGINIYRLTGNVGIGTPSPDGKLVISGMGAGLALKIEGAGSDSYFHNDAQGLHIKSYNGTNERGFKFHTGSDWTPEMVINKYGNVGIGTEAPDEKLHIVGNIKMVDGNQAAGKVLTSDANGVGTWQAAAGTIGGSGTANYIPRFTASTTLGNSEIYENGGSIGIGTTIPNAGSKLHVQHDNLYAGYFTSNYLNDNTNVIHSEFTGSGNYNAKAVYGYSRPADAYGYGGNFEGGYMGVIGKVFPSGSHNYFGVFGSVDGGSGVNYGLYGTASGPGINYGVCGSADFGITNWAGYFSGNVMVTGTLTKGGGSFKIDHPLDPENKYLYHSFVESPDMMNVYNGNVILDANGEAIVQLRAYFEALNRDFRYQLTCIGGFAPVYIAQEISGNQFIIAGGESGMKVSWQVTGIRHDKFAEANRIQVEVDKPDNERGKYLHPEAYNLGEEYDIHYEQNKQIKERMEREKME